MRPRASAASFLNRDPGREEAAERRDAPVCRRDTREQASQARATPAAGAHVLEEDSVHTHPCPLQVSLPLLICSLALLSLFERSLLLFRFRLKLRGGLVRGGLAACRQGRRRSSLEIVRTATWIRSNGCKLFCGLGMGRSWLSTWGVCCNLTSEGCRDGVDCTAESASSQGR